VAKRGRGASRAAQNWYSVERRRKDLGDGVGSGDNGGTPTLNHFGPGYIESRDIPLNALLDEFGNPILDENGDFILTE
jgi:hypothetical protein